MKIYISLVVLLFSLYSLEAAAQTCSLTSGAGTDAQSICLGNSIAPITYTFTGADEGSVSGLPASLTGSFSGGTLTISGTPVAAEVISYSVTLKQSGSAICTSSGTITVNTPPSAGVTIGASANPVCDGTSVTFTATPSNGGTTPSYQWYKGSTPVGTNSSTYTYTPSNGDVITVVMTSDLTCVTGNPATSGAINMTVNTASAASVTIGASANPVCEGTPVTFTATPSGGGTTPSYQWYNGSAPVGTNSSTYTYTSSNGDVITVVMTSDLTCVTGSPATSNAINMTVNTAPAASVTIGASGNPVCEGTPVTFTATPSNGGTTPSYQWYIGSTPVGTNISTYTYTPSNGDNIKVVMTSGLACVTGSPATSNVISMTVNTPPAAAVSIAASANPVCDGTSVTFTATPSNGGATPSYQWYKGATPVGTSSNTYTYSPANGDVITVVMSSSLTCVTGSPATSNPVNMTVNPLLPVSVSITGSANNICTGTSVTYTATPVNGGSTPSYQWYKGSTPVGTNSPSYTYNPANGDVITVKLTSSETCKSGSPATSNAITMTVYSSAPATPGTIAGSGTVCQGQTGVSYSISDVTNAQSYNWTPGTGYTIVSGDGTTDVVIDFDAGATSHSIYVNAQNTCGTSSNKSKAITVNTTPSATIDVDGIASTTVCQSETGPHVIFHNPMSAAVTITYTINGTNQSTIDVNATSQNYVVASTTIPGTYTYALVSVKYKSGTACSNNITGTATVNVTPTVGIPSAITVSAGSDPACQLTNGTTTTSYSTTATNSTGFNWSLSSSSAGSINATTGVMTWANGYSGTVSIRVTANGCNGPSSQVTRSVTVTPTVGTPAAITVSAGTEPVCQLPDGTTTTTYSTSAANSTGFNWSVSNSAAGSINPTSGVMTWANGFSGTVDIQVTANGCNGPSSLVKRTVNIKPNVGTPTPITVTAGSEPVCQLTNGTTTTTYSTTATNVTGPYNWSLSDASAGSINATTGVMTWANGFSGSVNIQVTATGCNGASPMTIRPVSITPAVGTPTPITIFAGSDPPCQLTSGTNMTIYTTTATNSTGFNWSVSNAAAGTINASNGLMTWNNGFSGSVNIIVTASGCGTSAPTTRSVTINPLPVISVSGPSSPRITSTGNVYTTQSGMTGYVWNVSGGGTGSGTGDTYTVAWNTGGNQTVSVNYIDSHGCTAVTPFVYDVSVKPVPSATNATITGYPAKDNLLTGSFTYSDGSSGTSVSTYRWLRNGTEPVTGATSLTYTPTADDINKTLTFEVTPVSTVGPPYTGSVIKSAPTEPVEDLTGVPVADNVCIQGIRALGNTLTGLYTYTFSKSEGISTYKWYRKDISTGLSIVAGTARTYTLSAVDLDDLHEIYFEVTPVSSNLTPIAGVPVQSGYLSRILIPKTEFSVSEKDVPLSANVGGGVFSGTGVSGTYFSPRAAGASVTPYVISYLNIVFTCSQQASKQVLVNPNVSYFVGFKSLYCHDEGQSIVKVRGVPTDATERKFSSTSSSVILSKTDSTATIDPIKLRPKDGRDSLFFSYKRSGIFYQISEAFFVDSISTGIKIINLDSAYCDGSAKKYISVENVYPPNGTSAWTGDLITDTDPRTSSANVDPTKGTPGLYYPLTYQYTSSRGCKSALLKARVRINKLPDPYFTLNDTYNIEGGSVDLVPSQTGGTFSGRGVSGSVLFPDIAGLGEDEITYSITDENKCAASYPKKTIIRQAQGSFTDITSIICYRDTTYNIKVTGLPTTGTLSITSFINTKKTLSYSGGTTAMYNVPAAGAGDDTLIFRYKWDNVDYWISRNLKIDKLDAVYIKYMNPGDTICDDRKPFELSVSKYEGEGVFSGPVSGNYMDPSKATRIDTIRFKYTNPATGCSTGTELPVKVFPSPKVNFVPVDVCIDGSSDTTKFINKTVSSDPVKYWKWEFMDENGGIAPPDTNKMGSYLFNAGGLQRISLTATTVTGCFVKKDTVFNLGVRPVADFYWKNDCMHPGDVIILRDTTQNKSPIISRSWSIFNGPEFSTDPKQATYPKSDTGFLKIQLTVRTNYENCNATIVKDVYIRPSITIPKDGYLDNFESGKNRWIRGETSGNTWSFGKPDRIRINKASSGQKAWFTGYSMVIPYKESSSVVSPCFDFTNIQRPVISLDIWKRFAQDRDGAALQYLIGDNKEGWQPVGSYDDGIEWYNSVSIRGEPGGGQLGWTTLGNNPDTSYVQAIHTLEGLSGKKDVKFRVTYGSDGSYPNHDGMAFDNVWLGERNRNILLEHFTNTTDISSSNANTMVNLIARNRKSDVINIQYHTNFPGSDPFYTANPGDAGARILFYGLTSVPYTFIDGGFNSDNFARVFDNKLAKIDSNIVTKRSLKPSIFSVALTANISGGILTVSGKVKALDAVKSDNLTMFLAVTEKVNKSVTGPLGEKEFDNVFRKFIPDAGGILLKSSWAKGDSLTIAEKSWVIDKVLNNADIEVIAFIQNTVSKEVYQAFSVIKPGITTGIEDQPFEAKSRFILYPNPAVNNLTVEFTEPLAREARLAVFDVEGVEIFSRKIGSGLKLFMIDDLNLKPGIYFVRINTGMTNMGIRKLVVAVN